MRSVRTIAAIVATTGPRARSSIASGEYPADAYSAPPPHGPARHRSSPPPPRPRRPDLRASDAASCPSAVRRSARAPIPPPREPEAPVRRLPARSAPPRRSSALRPAASPPLEQVDGSAGQGSSHGMSSPRGAVRGCRPRGRTRRRTTTVEGTDHTALAEERPDVGVEADRASRHLRWWEPPNGDGRPSAPGTRRPTIAPALGASVGDPTYTCGATPSASDCMTSTCASHPSSGK